MSRAAQKVDEASGLYGLLVEDHRRLDASFEDLVNASEAGAPCDLIGRLWGRFGAGVLAHLEAEEDQLFPALAFAHPDEVAALRAEHDQIRERLCELDLEVDLHLIRHPTVLEIVRRLREHAAREERTLYGWADRELGSAQHRTVLDRVRSALEGAAPSRRRGARELP